jgi:hypothetical protein
MNYRAAVELLCHVRKESNEFNRLAEGRGYEEEMRTREGEVLGLVKYHGDMYESR